ncbi:MAG: FKBP-type peptidyl-prolyl cis-trans isomerase [Bacteroidia bacterium]
MKKVIILTAAALMMFGCKKRYQTTENGVKYKIHTHEENAKPVGKGDMILVNLRITTEHDSVIMETFTRNNPRYIPFEEPVLTQVFAELSVGDSLEILVNADTLFNKSFGMPRPGNIKAGENVHFVVKVVESLNQQEILKRRNDQQKELLKKDSMARGEFMKNFGDAQQTASGIFYKVLTPSKGKQVKSGDKVQVKYKGTMLTGEVFDETKEGAEPFSFTVGLGQVIKGWDEALQLMHEGEKIKAVIPSTLAYGENGGGPIPPHSTLVFEIELLKIMPADKKTGELKPGIE